MLSKTKIYFLLVIVLFSLGCISTPSNITYFGHSSFMIELNNNKIYLDPYVLPNYIEKADFILISHDHSDHCNRENIKLLTKDYNPKNHSVNDTRIIGTIDCIRNLTGRTNSIVPGEYFDFEFHGIRVEAVPAYNEYHENGVGFILSDNKTRIYFAGDTGLIEDMKNITNIDIAILPIGGTYTMNVSEAAEAAKIINPKYAIPMHYNSDKYGIKNINADHEKLKKMLEGTGIQVIVMKPIA